MRSQSGQIMDERIQEGQKSQLPLLKSPEQKQGVGSKSRVLRMPPAHTTTKGVGKPPKLPLLRPTPGPAPTLTAYKESARPHLHPPQGANEQGNLLFVFAPSCCSRGPRKALPEFLVWHLSNFYRLRRPRTLVGNRWMQHQALQWRPACPSVPEPILAISAQILTLPLAGALRS